MYHSPQAYDRAITVFSPDGRLFQVEYAREAVKRGAPSVGITIKNGIVMGALKYVPSKLVVEESIRKIQDLEDNILFTSAGLIADAKRVSDVAREIAKSHRATYGEAPTVTYVVKEISSLFQAYTQFGGARPFGVSVMIGGFDHDEPVLYEIDPSGAVTGYKATAVGGYKKEIEKFLEEHYKPNMSLKEGLKLAKEALEQTQEAAEPNASEFVYLVKKKSGYELKYL
ncbi:MAG: archaeal proteasome endopeptidase complex subunit alpha [Candidatus Micrarchaeota archaeon]|nr:archaeal proteasome endopeptidase complex subunit alpha [Candidatus Micrarchaeota archaeon]